ncbi:hypothetical protein [Kutzneria chonburiensis]|uniref:Uncharacterized protein n=1 Tax=Kutzneria chonburiensis TaxID=1483604 RepID=A0ABV6MMW5_9PSEU|nr:hypothetical protein [Kutzneria chonburiensis]
MSSFEDTLWQDLMQQHGQELAAGNHIRPPQRRRPLVAAAALAVVGTGAVGLATGMLGGTPAYAVTEHPNGTVTVTLKEIAAADQTNAELRRRGIPIRVMPYAPDCANTKSYTVDESAPETALGDNNGAAGLTLDTTTVPPGDYAVITALSDADGKIAVMMSGGRPAKGEVPSCLRGDIAGLGVYHAPSPTR